MYFGVNSNLWFFGFRDYVYGTAADTNLHEIEVVWQPEDAHARVDGVEVCTLDRAAFTPYGMPLGLFYRNLGSVGYGVSGKMYWCQIETAAGLVRDFIPVRFTNELGQTEGAMYDKVSGTLFRNQGTGTFRYGNDLTTVRI